MENFRKCTQNGAFSKMYTKWGIFENVHKMGHFRKCTQNGEFSKIFENVHKMGHFPKCTQNGEFSKMYTKCYAHNCLIFSCKCHIFCFFIGIKFNIDKVAPTRNNLKTPKISRRFAPEMYTIWRKSHYQRISKIYIFWGIWGKIKN